MMRRIGFQIASALQNLQCDLLFINRPRNDEEAEGLTFRICLRKK